MAEDYLAAYRRLAMNDLPAVQKRLQVIKNGTSVVSANIEPHRGAMERSAPALR
jgi:hypothetical protein